MKLLVTGATGFVGRSVVEEALRAGHGVRAVVRAGADRSKREWANHPSVECAAVDLRSRRGLVDALRGVDCVLHLAATKGGDIYAQLAGTVVTTENLLWAMDEAGVRHIVHLSTFSVYDFLKLRSFALLDENAPIDTAMGDRDGYAQTKLIQENLVREHAQRQGWRWTILRPGMIFGRGNLFNARIGSDCGRWWLRTGSWARMPLTYVENCAAAIVRAAEHPQAAGQTLNVVDDEMPTQRRYSRLLQKHWPSPRPRIVPVSWTVLRLVARTAQLTNHLLLRDRAKLPGILVPARLHARCKPLRYSNAKIKEVLGWRPAIALEQAIERSLHPPVKLEAGLAAMAHAFVHGPDDAPGHAVPSHANVNAPVSVN